MKNHYICKIFYCSNGKQKTSVYFDGTQAQAIKYFKKHPTVKTHLKNSSYSVYVRGNSIDLNEV